MPHRYQLYGVSIESEVPLGAPPMGAGGGADVRLRRGTVTPPSAWEVVRRSEQQGEPLAALGRVHDGYVLRLHGLVDFFIDRAGRELTFQELRSIAPGVMEQLFVDQALPHALTLRGRVCLHASAVVHPAGHVIAFVGPSGFGKSTLAYELGKSWPWMTDDCLVLSREEAVYRVDPGEGASRMWVDSVESLVPADSIVESMSRRPGKRRVRPREVAIEPHPLGGIYMLDWDETRDEGVAVAEIRSRDAMMALAAHTFRVDAHDKSLLAAELDTLADLVARVSVRRLSYPHSYEVLALVRQALLVDEPNQATC